MMRDTLCVGLCMCVSLPMSMPIRASSTDNTDTHRAISIHLSCSFLSFFQDHRATYDFTCYETVTTHMLLSDNRLDADYNMNSLCSQFLALFFSICIRSPSWYVFLLLQFVSIRCESASHETDKSKHRAKQKQKKTSNNARCYFFRLKRLMIFWALCMDTKEQKVFDPSD